MGRLFDNAQLFTYLHESSDGFVQMLLFVGGAQLYTDAGLALRNHGIIEPGYEDAFLRHGGGETLAQRRVIQHHGADGALRGLDTVFCFKKTANARSMTTSSMSVAKAVVNVNLSLRRMLST